MKIRIMIVIAGVVCLLVIACRTVRGSAQRDIAVFQNQQQRLIDSVVVLDAGHGGEDGGAVAPDGTMEKDLNLTIANMIADYFDLFGIDYKKTRETDTALGDPALGSVRERKRADILSRFSLVRETEHSVLLSIHQNLFSQPQYSGTQVFYAKHLPASKELADRIQTAVIGFLQPENQRETKGSDENIYLLYRAQKPSVLVECGFLSNPAELERLKQPLYQSAISYAVARGTLNYLLQQDAKS